MEVESALVDHAAVAEATVVGRAHEIKQGPGRHHHARGCQRIERLKRMYAEKEG